jgi:hypothetical protein
MKLHDRLAVEGTDPMIYIGHRFYKDVAGHVVVSGIQVEDMQLHS